MVGHPAMLQALTGKTDHGGISFVFSFMPSINFEHHIQFNEENLYTDSPAIASGARVILLTSSKISNCLTLKSLSAG